MRRTSGNRACSFSCRRLYHTEPDTSNANEATWRKRDRRGPETAAVRLVVSLRSGAELHAAEALDGDRRADFLRDALEVLLDGELVVGNVLLSHQANLISILVTDARENLRFDNLRRRELFALLFSLLFHLLKANVNLLLHFGFRNVLLSHVLRRISCHMQADHVRGLGDLRIVLLARELDKDADLAAHVDVAGEDARALELIALAAADLDVLARLGEEHLVLVHERLLDVLALERDLGGLLAEVLVAVGVGDEVGLAVDLGERHGLLVRGLGKGDDALLRLLVDALGGDRETLLAEVLDGFVHVAVGGLERFLAGSHAGGGRLAELLDHVNRDVHL